MKRAIAILMVMVVATLVVWQKSAEAAWLQLVTPPTSNGNLEEGGPSIQDSWVYKNVSGAALDVQWYTFGSFGYLISSTGGDDVLDSPTITALTVGPNDYHFNSTDAWTLVPKDGQFTLTFTVTPPQEPPDPPPFDSGTLSVYIKQLNVKTDGTQIWSNNIFGGPTPTYTYTAWDEPAVPLASAPEPTMLVVWAGLSAMGLIAYVWRRRRAKA